MAENTLSDLRLSVTAPRRQLRAEFFVRSNGECFPRARPLSERQRADLFRRSNRMCAACGCLIARLGRDVHPFMRNGSHGQIDHIFPRSRGGQNNPENLRLLCVTCNTQKGAR